MMYASIRLELRTAQTARVPDVSNESARPAGNDYRSGDLFLGNFLRSESQ